MRKIILLLFVLASMMLTMRVLSAYPQNFPKANVAYSPLPKDKEGSYPVHMPEYNGVEQLLLLSNKWVVVATINIDEVVNKIDELSGGDYKKHLEVWEKSVIAGKHNWTVLRNMIQPLQKKYYAEARELSGERNLDNANFYQIRSETDENYAEPKHPIRVTRYINSLGEGNISRKRVSGGYDILYAQYSYLEMPELLKNGNTYTILMENGKEVTFLYDELRTVSRAIKVNQVGYLSSAKQKYAYLSGYLHEFGPLPLSEGGPFYVVNVKSGDVAFQGKVKLRAENPRMIDPQSKDDPEKRPYFSGENIYELDFSGLQEEGEFFISVPDVGRSWAFHHGPNTYGEAFYTVARGLYHQRSGMPIESKYSAWSRESFHTEPVYENAYIFAITPISEPKNYTKFDVIGATTDTSKVTKDATGGWYDAADWDKNLLHYTTLFDLLFAYQIAPDHFNDKQLNLPESNNNIPDILDEAEYGLLVWKKSMTEQGGTSGALETWTHPTRDSKDVKYSYTRRTRWSSLLYAAAAAKFAMLVKPFDPDKSAEYAASAIKAFGFGKDPKNSVDGTVIQAAKNRGSGEKYTVVFNENEKDIYPFIIQAGASLYALTGDKSYLEGVPELLMKTHKPYEWPFSIRDFSPWLFYDITFGKASEVLPQTLRNQWRTHYFNYANKMVNLSKTQPYRISWPQHQDFWMAWGSTTMTNQARSLFIAYAESGDDKYREAAIHNIDFMLGANPMGMSWTTGLGYTYPIEIQHGNSEDDGIMDPVPGIPIYGTTGVFPRNMKEVMWQNESNGKTITFMKEQNTDLPVWRRWASHPHINVGQNEFTIHETISSGIFCYGMLLTPGWMPDRQLKERKPRKDELLFGYWYLP